MPLKFWVGVSLAVVGIVLMSLPDKPCVDCDDDVTDSGVGGAALGFVSSWDVNCSSSAAPTPLRTSVIAWRLAQFGVLGLTIYMGGFVVTVHTGLVGERHQNDSDHGQRDADPEFEGHLHSDPLRPRKS